jgi:hypothetical protein
VAKFWDVRIMDGPNKTDRYITGQKDGTVELMSEKGMTKYRIMTIPEIKIAVMESNFETMTEEQILKMIEHKLWLETFT